MLSKSSSLYIRIEDLTNATDYDFPPEEHHRRRHISNFTITDKNDSNIFIPPLTQPSVQQHYFLLRGDLVVPDPAKSKVTSKSVAVRVIRHTINFGTDVKDEENSRGIWFESVDGILYKLVPPFHKDFHSLSQAAYDKYYGFMRVFDALLFTDPEICPEEPDKRGRYQCSYNIKQVYEMSKRHFSLRYVIQNKAFVREGLAATIAPTSKFMKSLASFSGKPD
jgi:hypothetical protein